MIRGLVRLAVFCALLVSAPVHASSDFMTIDVHGVAVADVLALLSAQSGRNIVADSSVGAERVTLYLRRVTLQQALAVLTSSFGLAMRTVGGTIVVSNGTPAKDDRGKTEAHVYRLRFLRPSEIAASLKSVVPETSFFADDAQNAVIVTGPTDVQAIAKQVLSEMDVPSAQVMFEVRVADVRPVSDQSDIGIQFGGYDLSGQPVAGAATYAFAHNSLAINAKLNALISSGHAQILATPKLMTLNNHEADLLIGETYPVVYYDARLGGQQVQFVDIGVKLRLTPTIGSDGSVTAELHPEYSAIEGFVGGYPVLTSRRVDSKLHVADNETIVLGGLIREMDSETMTKVPGLSSIPILGKLFEDRQRTHQRDEVIFLITPHVMFPGKAGKPDQPR